MAFKTQQQVTQDYITNIKAINTNANPEAIGTDWFVKSNIQGGVISGIYQDNYNTQQAVFIQNAYGSTLDYYLASKQLTPRLAATPATGYAAIPEAPDSTITIPSGTQLTLGSSVYLTTATVTATPLDYSMLVPIESQTTGSGTALANGTQINFSTSFDNISYLVIDSMNDGAPVESDSEVKYRILTVEATPKTGGNLPDYQNWAISQRNITNSFYQEANILGLNQLALYFMSGGGDVDTILASIPPGDYSRTTTQPDIDNAGLYIDSVRPLFDNLVYNTVYTYIVNDVDDFNITDLVLTTDVTLATILPGFTITVEDLIKRELRRAVLSTALGGVAIGSNFYMILDGIQNQIYQSLNVIDGIYANIIISFKFDFNGLTDNILLPKVVNGTGAYPAVYDCNYTNILIS